jgi:uncharacterized protein (TIGR03437 family)
VIPVAHRPHYPARLVCIAALAVIFLQADPARAAVFGKVFPVRGQVSDIALDTKRSLLYAANFTANRVEVFSTASQTFQQAMSTAPQPSAVTVSPDGRYLVVGHYFVGTATPNVALTVFNLETGGQQTISLGTQSVLAAAFGAGSNVLVVTTTGVNLIDPATGRLSSLRLTDFASTPLQVPWATSPSAIISGSTAVSGDGNMIYAIVDQGATASIVRYNVAAKTLFLVDSTSSPNLGPRSLSTDQTGATLLAGWALLALRNNQLQIFAQFPAASGVLNRGGHAFDPIRNLIYAQMNPGAIQSGGSSGATAPLFQVFDPDNLTVRETFRLSENLSGRALLSGDAMYVVSDSGLMVLPTGALSGVNRVNAGVESLLFQSNGCTGGVLSKDLDIVDPGGLATDFALTSSSPAVTFSVNSGTTPARVQVLVNPSLFQTQKGTSVASIQISSGLAVNVPAAVRVLVNTREPDQRGAIYDIPGTIVDVLPDPLRDRFYMLRQDRNQVLVYDGSSMDLIAILRTGNTPIQMAISQDTLLVTSDNSQIVSAFDLSTLNAISPVFLPSGNYARSIAAANGTILATTRSVAGPPQILSLDLATRTATPITGGIYRNLIDPNSVVAASPSGQSVFLAMPDGTVALYDADSKAFITSRKDVGPLSGAYAALSDSVFTVGGTVFNQSLVPMGQLNLLGGTSSGAALVDGQGLLTTTPAGAASGLVQRFSMDQLATYSPARTAEAPKVPGLAAPPPLGQVGQTLLPFTRTLAPLSNRKYVAQLSTSGVTMLPWVFESSSPAPAIQKVTNAADQSSLVAPGGLISLWGTGMSGPDDMPGQLSLNASNSVCLYANSLPVPLLFASPTQLNAQLPFSVQASARLVLVTSAGSSAPFTVAVQPSAPAVFRDSGGAPLIVRSDGRVVSNSAPMHLDEKYTVYLTGLGAVAADIGAGTPAPAAPPVTTAERPAVYIGPTQLFTLWSGLAPGMIGVNQINVQVPFKNVSTGSKVQFTIIQGGVETKMFVPVE